MVEHDTRGALGVVVNRVIGKGRLGMLLRGFGIEQGAEADAEIDLHEGGPVERDRMMVLHSPDYEGSDSVVSERAVLTESIEILRDMATGQGPLHSIVMLGYAGWAPDQLESEIARGSWFTVEGRRRSSVRRCDQDQVAAGARPPRLRSLTRSTHPSRRQGRNQETMARHQKAFFGR